MHTRTKYFLFLLLLLSSPSYLLCQMVQGPDTLVGNEWIKYDRPYYKFSVSTPGVYRLTAATLTAAGMDPSGLNGAAVRVYAMGQQVPIEVSTDGLFGATDYIEFYGEPNHDEMDRFLFRHPDTDLLNADYSMYDDRRWYYLTLDDSAPLVRVATLPNDLDAPPPAENFYWHDETILYKDVLHDPYLNASEAVSYSSYVHGEGFAKSPSNSYLTTIPVTGLIDNGKEAQLHLRFVSTNFVNHQSTLLWNGQAIATFNPNGIQIVDTVLSLPLTSLTDANELKITSTSSQSLLSMVRITLTYPQRTDAKSQESFYMRLSTEDSDAHYLLENFQHNSNAPVIFSTDGYFKMNTKLDADQKVEFRWPWAFVDKDVFIYNEDTQVHTIDAVQEIEFTDFSNDDTEYVILTHPDLLEPGTDGEYTQYRRSQEGGAYNAKAYNILDLYDQFGYGILRHPQAIRNFVEFVHRHWPSAKMIFIVGRGLEYQRSRIEGGGWEPYFFVPTFGKPGSDNLLAATTWDLVPRYPIGRLAAINRDAIAEYLAKVKEHDIATLSPQTIEDKAWIKNIIHISGGKNASEQVAFKQTLNTLGQQIADSDFAGNVFAFQKETSDIIGESQSKQIEKLLHDGSTLINYLGHSSANTFEFTINDASEWNNKGRYPVFSAMGCSAGQIFGTSYSLSDRYVQVPEEGAIAFISGSGSQFPNALISWARPWYDSFGSTNYGNTLGESIHDGLVAVSAYVNIDLVNVNPYRYLLEQQTFQGDPALHMNPLPGPDYTIDRKSVSISPEILNTDLDSFDLSFAISNIGRNLHQTGMYRMQFQLPDGNTLLVRKDTVHLEAYENKVTLRLPMPADAKAGTYRLLIDVDPDNALMELPDPDAELNNSLRDAANVTGIPVVLLSNVVTTVYPDQYAIVNAPPVLVATSSNAFNPSQDMRIEIDTTALFNSDLHYGETFAAHSAVLKWSPPITWLENTVYYWRVSFDSLSPDQGYLWNTSSFLYKSDSPSGWNQSHFHQWTNDQLDQLIPDSLEQKIGFGSATSNFRILNRFHDGTTSTSPFGFIDNIFFTEFFSKFVNNDVHVFAVAVSPVTGEYLIDPNPGLYGSFNNLSYDIRCFPYRSDLASSRQDLIHFLEDIVPEGYLVFFYTYQRTNRPDYFPEQWAEDEAVYGKSIFSVIEAEYPGSKIRTLATTGSRPYIVVYQKGYGGLEEVFGEDNTSIISVSYDIPHLLHEGRITSTLVGPASMWHSIQYELATMPGDTVGADTLKAIAVSADLSDTLLLSNNLISHDTLIADIDAGIYPYIQLSFSSIDSLDFKPSPLRYWRVLYDGYPELVLNRDIGFEFIADTLYQGETSSLKTFVENVSPYAVDDLPVSLRITRGNQTIALADTLDNVPAFDYAPVQFSGSTKELQGDYQVIAEINPSRSIPEVNYANNIGVLPMYVIADDLNPVLDVTFDGFHIRDNDLVAAKPLIRITLNDENEYLRMKDTSAFIIYLTYPSSSGDDRVFYTLPWVHFIPSPDQGPNEVAVELTPDLWEDGTYELTVLAKDASGNEAGDNAYYVSFRVSHERSVSVVTNFPNPFHYSTRFMYTLTGDASPAFYEIQIVAVTGQVVRTITQDEIGPLAVGTHPISYTWDGSADNGSPLSAGTYFYRMVVRDENGQEYKRLNQSGDAQFRKKGWGKLVILR